MGLGTTGNLKVGNLCPSEVAYAFWFKSCILEGRLGREQVVKTVHYRLVVM